MKRTNLILLILILLLGAAFSAEAVDIDPILIDKPSVFVYECSENLFFEVLVDPIIEYNTGGRQAENEYFILTAEFLFLEEKSWSGLDKNSFELRHTLPDGTVEVYPLNYMITSMLALKNGWLTFSDTLDFGSLLKMTLVFDINTLSKTGWTLVFHPAERGGQAFCEVEIPLKVRN